MQIESRIMPLLYFSCGERAASAFPHFAEHTPGRRSPRMTKIYDADGKTLVTSKPTRAFDFSPRPF